MDDTQPRFGGEWTERKLDVLEQYLAQYCTIFRANRNARQLETTYIDAFAGTGRVHSRGRQSSDPQLEGFEDVEAREYMDGSARRALLMNPGFDHHIFVENNPNRARTLRDLGQEFAAKDVQVKNDDANSVVQAWCANARWNDRACLFLDPYGMEVDWITIQAVAETQKIDMWFWFSIMGLVRQLTKDGLPPIAWRESLTRSLGTDEWMTFYNESPQGSLFDWEGAELKRNAGIAQVEAFVISRLRTVFGNGVAPNPRRFNNSKGSPMFLLCFATGTKNPSAQKAALRIAEYLLGKA